MSTIVRKMGPPVSGGDSGHTTATNTNTSNTPVHHRHHFPHHQSTPTNHHHLSASTATVSHSSASQDCEGDPSLPPSPLLHHQGGLNSSYSRLWRTRSCTAAIRFASSKRHGRNLKMEQKATKVRTLSWREETTICYLIYHEGHQL